MLLRWQGRGPGSTPERKGQTLEEGVRGRMRHPAALAVHVLPAQARGDPQNGGETGVGASREDEIPGGGVLHGKAGCRGELPSWYRLSRQGDRWSRASGTGRHCHYSRRRRRLQRQRLRSTAHFQASIGAGYVMARDDTHGRRTESTYNQNVRERVRPTCTRNTIDLSNGTNNKFTSFVSLLNLTFLCSSNALMPRTVAFYKEELEPR